VTPRTSNLKYIESSATLFQNVLASHVIAYVILRAITFRSDNGTNFDRAITLGCHNGFNELEAITFLHYAKEELCNNAKCNLALSL
jgi:hypothetical protein